MSNNSHSPTVLVLPYPVQGHVNPMMSFSQKLVDHGCKVIFVTTEFNHKRLLQQNNNTLLDDGSSSSRLKLVSIPDGLEPEDERTDFAKLNFAMRSTMPCVIEKLIEDSRMNDGGREHGIRCIVVDLIMGWGLEVASKMGIKGVHFFPASAAMFALMHNIPKLIDDAIIDSCGLPITKKTFRLSESMPLMNTESLYWSNVADPINIEKVFNYLVHCTETLNLAEWWLCNTTYELEPEALSFVPKLLPIGPVLTSYNNTSSNSTTTISFWEEDLSCLSWLDQQPHCSVLYVAFGSFTLFNEKQFKELALGLDLTDRPFLWVVRQDSTNFNNNKLSYPIEFRGSKGKIVGWAPQQRVLSHPAIACFVSHCGWNSTVEGLSNGVPFLCWPYFSDQLFDKTYICDELKVGLGFEMDEKGLVSRVEIKTKVDQLLGDESIRARSLELKEKLMNDIVEGGRSLKNLYRFVEWLKD